MNDYKDMIVWQKSMDIVESVYLVTNGFPKEEADGLVPQLRKAAIAISSNIAQGSSRKTNKEFLRFLNVANGALSELETLIMLSRRFSYISANNEIFILKKANEVGKIIRTFEDSLVHKIQQS